VLVRLTVSLSGTREGQTWPPRNSVMELPDAEGADMCAAGMAVPVPQDPDPVETAVVPAAEERSEKDALYARATELGVKVDGRWSVARLREEIAKAES
jgi:hypothetical protein